MHCPNDTNGLFSACTDSYLRPALDLYSVVLNVPGGFSLQFAIVWRDDYHSFTVLKLWD